MSDPIIVAPNGTSWTNVAPDSEDISNGWTLSAVTLSSAVTTIDQFSAQGIIPTNTVSTIHGVAFTLGGVGNPGITNADDVYVSAYVSKDDVDWCFLRVAATNAGFAAVGGEQYFDLATPATGSFVASGAGTLTKAGIETVLGGYKVWAIIDCGGDNANGLTTQVGSADSDEGKTYTAADTTSIQTYLSGIVVVDGASGQLPYIAT